MASPISLITLLTDFGTRDHFVASMKGVILNVNAQARIIDLSHEVDAHDVEGAAFLLKSCYRYFPEGTIHVVVVDPEVGTGRRPLLVSTSRYLFLAPDNGVLTSVIEEELSVEVRTIQNQQYRLDSEGATFDGRDLFAPAAAWLTRGQVPGSFGPLIRDYARLRIDEPQWSNKTLKGRVGHIDRFGNVISNLSTLHVKEVQGKNRQGSVTVNIGGLTIDGLLPAYAAGSTRSPQALINSNGLVEIFLKEGSAADLLKCKRGDPVELS